MPGAAPGLGQFLNPGFIQAQRALQMCPFGAASLAAPSTSRTSTWLALGLAHAHFQQGWPEGSTPSLCLCLPAPVGSVWLLWVGSKGESPCSRKCQREPRAKESLPCRPCFFSALKYFQCWSGLMGVPHPTQKEADGWIFFENFSQVEPGRGLFTGRSCYNKYPDASPRVSVFQHSWPFLMLLK